MMHYTQDEKDLILRCWKDRHEGAHGYSLRNSGLWLTIEPIKDGEYELIITALTYDIDALGYPMGEILKTDLFDPARIAKLEKEVIRK